MDQIKLFKFSGSNSNCCFGCTKHTFESGKPTVGSQGNTSLKLYIFWQGAAPSGTSSGTYFTQEPTISRAKLKKVKIRGNSWSVVPIPTKKCDGLVTINPFHMIPFCVATTQKLAKKQPTKQSPNHRTHRTRRTHRTCGTWLPPGQDQRYRVSAHSTTHVTKMETKITAKNLSST